jgi:hypothetical protein
MVFDKVIELIYDIDIEIKLEAIKFAFSCLDQLSAYTLERRMNFLFLELLSNTNSEVQKLISNLSNDILSKLLPNYLKPL